MAETAERELAGGVEWLSHRDYAYRAGLDYPGCLGTLVLRESLAGRRLWVAECDSGCGFEITTYADTVRADLDRAGREARLAPDQPANEKRELPWRHH